MLKIFIGYDHRQPISYTVLQHSILTQSSQSVSITPLIITQLPITRTGLTPFTFSRFLVPYLCDYQGWGLFLDADIALNADISELFKFADDKYSIMVAKNELRFEWASVMLFNCSKCKILTPDYVENASGLHQIKFVPEDEIGCIPPEWNFLVGYDEYNPDAKLIHYTQGVPAYPETQGSEHEEVWKKWHNHANASAPWVQLMGESVHVAVLDGKIVPKWKVKKYEKEGRIQKK